jgi:hypothetical protein
MNRWIVSFLSMGLAIGPVFGALAQTNNGTPPSTMWLSGANPHGQRQFPPKAQRATMTVVNTQEVTLDDKPVRLAPAARIRTVTNSLMNTGALMGQQFTVNYITDHMGQVLEAWILTEAEIAQRLPTDTPR